MGLLGKSIGLDPGALVTLIATQSDDTILEELARGNPNSAEGLAASYASARAEAQLIEGLGDPSPHRLA